MQDVIFLAYWLGNITYVEQEVGSHMRQAYDRYRVARFIVRVDLVSCIFERNVYI
jgi:hypothetical protein